jgi:single-strand DNA-binding protein
MQKITVRGYVVSLPEKKASLQLKGWTEFRMGKVHKKFDKVKQEFVDLDSTYYSVQIHKPSLANNVIESLAKADHIIVSGHLEVATFKKKDGTTGTANVILADAIGFDMNYSAAQKYKAPNRE